MATATYSRAGIQGYVGLSDELFEELCEELCYDSKLDYYTEAEYMAIMVAAGWTNTDEGWTK